MGSTQPFLRRALAPLLAGALAASALVVGAAPAAVADPANPTPVSGPLPTAQLDGVVWTQAVVNGVDYVGGSFANSQPAGAAKNVDLTPRSNLFAYDVTTGVALPGFDTVTNGQVRSVAASSDGSRIYIGGTFTTVDGQPRDHLAAISPSGQLLPDFTPSVNGQVVSIAVRGSSVYFVGDFSAVDGAPRTKAAAVTAQGAVLRFAPVVSDYHVRAVAVSPSGEKVLLGGSFQTVNGKSYKGLAAVDAVTGASMSWASNSLIYDSGDNSAIYSLSSRGGVVYATGYVYLGGGAYGNLEGAIAMNWSDGSAVWVDDCSGDTYSSVPFNDALYTAGHAHDCSKIGGFGATSPTTYHRAIAFSQAASSQVVVDPNNLVSGQPAPSILNWLPDINAGTYTGLSQGPWSVAAGDGYLVYGGEFTRVDGVRQTGLVRFQGQPDSPDPVVTPTPTPTPTPTGGPTATKPNRVAHPNAVPLGPTRVAVKWSAPKGAKAAKVTSYLVKAYKGSTVVKTVKVGGSKRLAVITGLAKSTSYRIGVAAKNAAGLGRTSVLDGAKTKATGKNVSATKHPSKVAKPSTKAGTAKVKVHWKGASAKGALGISKYQIRIMKAGAVVKTVTVGAKVRTKTVTKLIRKAGYKVSVRACNWAGWGSWSTARSVRTR